MSRWIGGTLSGCALIAAGAATAVTAGEKPPKHDTIGVGETVTLRVRGSPARAKRLAERLQLRRLSDGDEVPVTCVSGRPLLGESREPFLVVPYVLQEALIESGLDPAAAPQRAERLIRRVERSGRTRLLTRIRGFGEPGRTSLPVLTLKNARDNWTNLPIPTEAPTEQERDRRRRIAGDDDAWRRYLAGDELAEAELTGPDAGLRFRAHPDGGSQLEHVSFRRVLMRRSPREITVLPHVPQREGDTRALEADSLYELRRKSGAGFPVRSALSSRGARIPVLRDALRLRVHPWEYPYDRDHGDFVSRPQPLIRVMATMPPPLEPDVPLDRSWANPLSLGLPDGESSSPRVDVFLSAPIATDRLQERVAFDMTAADLGTPLERIVRLPVRARVEIEQSHLGDVRLMVHPLETLEPRCRYTVRLRGNLSGLDGQILGTGYQFSFATEAGAPRPETFISAAFDDPRSVLGDHPRFFEFEDTAIRDHGSGVLTADPTLPESETITGWFDTGRYAPRLFPSDLTATRDGAPGTTVQILARTAPQAWGAAMPELVLATPFTPIEDIATISDRRWIQFRVVFTVPEGLPVDAEMPAVERIVVGVHGDL